MSVLFDRRGWNELTIPTDVDPAVTLVTAPDDNTRILIRRIRGTVTNAFSVNSGSTAILSVPAGTIDIPGLEIATKPGANLRASGTANTGQPKLQWAFDRLPTPSQYK